MPSRAKLWHVGIAPKTKNGYDFAVFASEEPLPFYCANSHMRIRAISGHAAAKRFIRGNLADILTGWNYESCDNNAQMGGFGKIDERYKGITPREERAIRRSDKDESKTLCQRIMRALPEFVQIVVLKNKNTA